MAYLIFLNWGVIIKGKKFIFSLILLSVILLSSSCAFALEDNATVSNVEINDDNSLTIDDSYLLSESDETQSVVTKDTFYNYFDAEGNLLDSVTSDELVFKGDFTGLDVNYISISKAIKLTGDNVALNNVAFVIAGDNVVIDGFNFTHSDYALFTLYGVSGVTLSNNVINFNALEGSSSYAILANTVSDLKIINNTLNYVGNTDGTTVNNAIFVTGDEDSEIAASGIVIEGNIFNIEIPSVAVGYDPLTYAPEVMSEGIVFYYCNDVKFNDNRLNVKYNKVSGYYDTIYALSVRGNPFNFISDEPIVSSNIEITNNVINVTGNNYVYAILLSAEEFVISDNVIDVVADAYYANAISIEGPSSDGDVSDNLITLKAPNAVYGIYSYQFNGAVKDVVYSNNTIAGEAYAACGMEIVETNTKITDNSIVMNGTYAFGIVSSVTKSGEISGNNILVIGTNDGENAVGDSLLSKNTIGISVKGNMAIGENYVNSTGIGINLVGGKDIFINDNEIYVDNVGDVESYAICANGVNNLNIEDNKIVFVGNTSGAAVNNAILVSGDDEDEIACTNVTFKNNDVDISLPSVAVGYDPITYEPTIASEGIVFYYCNNLTITDNRINLKYNKVSGSYDTIYVVSIRSNAYIYDSDDDFNLVYPIVSSGVVISNNNITAEGHSYVYGLYLAADNATVSDNKINVKSDDYYANGINVDALSTNGIIKNNEINVVAQKAAYGICSADYMGPIENMTYEANKIETNAYASCAIELMEENPIVSQNTIFAYGNYTYGIVISIKGEAIIVDNVVGTHGSENGTDGTGDSLLPKQSLGISIKGDASISTNTIGTSGIGIKVLNGDVDIISNEITTLGDYTIYANGSDLTIKENYLVSKKAVGVNSIISDNGFVASDNIPSIKTVIFAPGVSTVFNPNGVSLPVTVYDENGEAITNALVNVIVNGVSYTATTDAKGVANVALNLNAGNYDALITYSGNDTYGPKTVNTEITVTKLSSKIIAKSSVAVFLTTIKSGYYYNIVLKDVNGNVLANQDVNLTFNGKTSTYTTDENGTINVKLSATKAGTYTLNVAFDGGDNYAASSLTSKVVITKKATKVVAAKKTFKASTKTKKYTVILKDAFGKVISNAKVTIKVNGKTYTAVTASNGKATFKITKLTKKGTYSAVVKFAGNTYYKDSSKAVKIVVKK